MKRIIALAFFTAFIKLAMAQTSFGIVGGMNESSFNQANSYSTTNTSTDRSSTSALAGFNVGAFVQIDINKFSIQPGLIYTTKGSNTFDNYFVQTSATTNTTSTSNLKVTLNYLEIPVNVLYNITLKGKHKVGRFFVGASPYLAYGLSIKASGTTTTTNVSNGVSSSSIAVLSGNPSFGSAANQTNNPDFGINALIGLDLRTRYKFSVGYGWGLTNLSHDSAGKFTNNSLHIDIGYAFK